MADLSDETAQAQKVAVAAARGYYQASSDVRVTDTDGPTQIFGIRDQNKVESRAWVFSVEVEGKETRKLTVIRDGQGWHCIPTSQE